MVNNLLIRNQLGDYRRYFIYNPSWAKILNKKLNFSLFYLQNDYS